MTENEDRFFTAAEKELVKEILIPIVASFKDAANEINEAHNNKCMEEFVSKFENQTIEQVIKKTE